MNKRPELDCTNPPGQIVNPPEYPVPHEFVPKRGTLGEYIDRTLKHEAMLDRQWNKKKKLMTFDTWWDEVGFFLRIDEDQAKEVARAAWKAAQENAPSPKAPGA